MASPYPYWVEKKNSERIIQLIEYDFSWVSLTMLKIAEMFTSETSAYQGLLVILEQAVSLLSFRDLLVRLHLMICFFPFSIKTNNSLKKRQKNSIGSYKPRTCDWKRTDHCKGVWERWMSMNERLRWVCGGLCWVCVLTTYCGSGSFVFIVIYTRHSFMQFEMDEQLRIS